MRMSEITDEPTWRCPQNPFIGALGIQEPVIPGEPLIKRQPMALGSKIRRRESPVQRETTSGSLLRMVLDGESLTKVSTSVSWTSGTLSRQSSSVSSQWSVIRSSTASFFYSLNTDIIFPKTLIVNITKALSSSNLGSPMMKMKRIPKTNHNVPKAWFLVLGCNRQDGKGEIQHQYRSIVWKIIGSDLLMKH